MKRQQKLERRGILLTSPGMTGGVGPILPKQHDVTLLCYNGAVLTLSIIKLIQDFTYAGRLWSYNHQHSQQANRHVYCEVTDQVVAEIRHNAHASLEIAQRFEAQLKMLKESATNEL